MQDKPKAWMLFQVYNAIIKCLCREDKKYGRSIKSRKTGRPFPDGYIDETNMDFRNHGSDAVYGRLSACSNGAARNGGRDYT